MAWFSSAEPHVIATDGASGAPWVAASTVATKPVTSSQNSNPDSCGSSAGVKNDPDWSIRPANVPGLVHAACSAASPPRLCPTSTGRWVLGHAASSAGSTWSVRAAA